MPAFGREQLDWIGSQQERMLALLMHWAEINSGTFHRAGLERMAHALLPEFSSFDTKPELVDLPHHEELNNRGAMTPRELGQALRLRRRPDAPRRVLLAIHMDTVYAADSEFQTVHLTDDGRLRGPGVADAKGGLVVLLVALECLERYVLATGNTNLGWEVVINPDEEIASPGSREILKKAAARNHVGMLYEPALPGGELASERKGTAYFSIAVRGKSAHAGRHFEEGRNAVIAAAAIAGQIHALNGRWEGTTLNVARIDGGGPTNMVPEIAVVRLNVRYPRRELEDDILAAIDRIIAEAGHQDGIRTERYGEFTNPPKLFDVSIQTLFGQVAECSRALGRDLDWRPTGGSCDGNRLAGWGLPNVDTLGVRGGGIHSPDEFMIVDSLTERAALSASLLIGWASGDLDWPYRSDSSPKDDTP